MAKLYFKYGTMGSSKTAQALMTKFNYEEKGKKVLLLKPSTDDRDGKYCVKSRIGLEAIAIVVKNNMTILASIGLNKYEGLNSKYDVIIVDEAQFLTSKQVEELRMIVDMHCIPVLCFGLKTTSKSYLFEGSKRLLEIADSISEIKSICKCGNKAIINARFDDNGNVTLKGEDVFIGGNDFYEGMCYSCWQKKLAGTCHMQIEVFLSDNNSLICDYNYPTTYIAKTNLTKKMIKLCKDNFLKSNTYSAEVTFSYVYNNSKEEYLDWEEFEFSWNSETEEYKVLY